MDVQRQQREGKANGFVVIPITNVEVLDSIKVVQDEIVRKNKDARHAITKSLVDLESNQVHLTLFGLHANKSRMEMVKKAINSLSKILAGLDIESSFVLQLEGIGNWVSLSGRICTYADISEGCKEVVHSIYTSDILVLIIQD
eukprot:TRINITY_DN2545_c0_g1_i3.p1 TRINITY_DN2545_c0_g1~~TRINITY_DN2545_c0_g1_i3.p1  ORF type:complete len:143 (+),score=14.22 TRINITY_DN2545_c0_g1_i3:39-467(+)